MYAILLTNDTIFEVWIPPYIIRLLDFVLSSSQKHSISSYRFILLQSAVEFFSIVTVFEPAA